MSLNENSITFGKYKDLTLKQLLRDRKYCSWLLEQSWFLKQYEYLYNKVKEYKPEQYFFQGGNIEENVQEFKNVDEFLEKYPYFNLKKIKDLQITLEENEQKCYKFYKKVIRNLKEDIQNRIFVEGSYYKENPYDIKAPNSWLKKFEKKYGLSKDIFKEFLNAYGLKNIPYIVEDIKKMGGITYKGAKTFIIAKENSLKQEKFWETVLKDKYGELISSQYKFKNCIFDFINVKKGVLYEAKLSLKNYNEQQYNKYTCVIGTFKLVYLIDKDCVIHMDDGVLYTTNPEKYDAENVIRLRNSKDKNRLEKMIENFKIVKVENVSEVL